MQESYGYTMPLPVKFWPRASAGILWLLLAAACLASRFPEFQSLVDLTDTKRISLNLTALLTGPLFLAVGTTCFVKLHVLPQGVALTLCGLTLRRVPAEEIRVISAVQYSHKADAVDQLALCLIPLPEILEKEHMDASEETRVHRYLYRRSGLFRVNLNLNRHILWLDWSPARLKLLRQMYPKALWMDGSPDKRFENQLA